MILNKVMDFTLNTFRRLLKSLAGAGYSLKTVKDFYLYPSAKAVVLRHDVDKMPLNSLRAALIENDLGIKGTYYFRTARCSFDKSVISEISNLGHEIGYHYEDMGLARHKTKDNSVKLKTEREKELAGNAIESFTDNLAKLREITDIQTICMHGSPLRPVDGRLLWKYYDYTENGIIAEPYFDFSLEDMLFLTDTGRRWDGSSVSIRDKIYSRDPEYYSDWRRKPKTGSAMLMTEKGNNLQKSFRIRKTEDILHAIRLQSLPAQVMITFHPQRWSDNYREWTRELMAQSFKNQIKYLINIKNH